MWPAAVAAAPVATCSGRADSYAVETMKMFGIPESTLAKTLREIERDIDLAPLEITTCLRRGAELEIDVRYREQDARAPRLSCSRRFASATATSSTPSAARASTRSSPASFAGGRSRSPSRAPGGRPRGPADRAPRRIRLLQRRRRRLLGRAPRSTCSGSAGADRRRRRRFAGGRRGDGPRRDRALRSRRRRRDHRRRRPGGGTEEKPVGYVCICVVDADGNVLARDPKLPGSRSDVRDRSASVAMHMIRRLLIGEDLPV